MNTYKAFRVEENEKVFSTSVKEINHIELEADMVRIKVDYSSLNYKDALSATGNKGVTRNFPHTPGIDAAGVVEVSNSDLFKAGDKVIVTSYDLGMSHPGGMAEYVQVPAKWVVALPEGLTTKEAMVIGTAGLTAALCVQGLVDKVKPEDGTILVSGATGGVGSMSVAILAKLGYKVAAVTGKTEEEAFLKSLGADSIVDRNTLSEANPRPMLKCLYAGAIDTVGGDILANTIKMINPQGVVTCCGNAASFDLPLTVFPFILRGVSLVGIDSQNAPMANREIVWNKLAAEWKPAQLLEMFTEVGLDTLKEQVELILKGKIKGRVLVDVNR